MHHYQKTVNVHAALMKAHPRQHWKALGQARNLVKRVYVPRDVTPGRWDRDPKAQTNVYEYMCEMHVGTMLAGLVGWYVKGYLGSTIVSKAGGCIMHTCAHGERERTHMLFLHR